MKNATLYVAIVILLLTMPPPVSAQPAPPSGFVWQQTFNDDMDFVDHAKWNGMYATTLYCGVSGSGCDSNYQWLTSAGGALFLTAQINYSNFKDIRSGRAAENTHGKFVQRYGYFEWKAQLPHDAGGEGDGLWTALYAFPRDKDGKAFTDFGCGPGVPDSGHEEADVAEVVGGRNNMRQVRFTIHDQCFNEFGQLMPAKPGADLSAAYHTYGLYWKNDGSPHGTMCPYFDGAQQGGCHTLDSASKFWDAGIYLLNQVIPCPPNNVPFGGGAPCQRGTSSNNPLYVDYTRAWQLVALNGQPPPTPQPTPSPQPSPGQPPPAPRPSPVPSPVSTPPPSGASASFTMPASGSHVNGYVQVSANWSGPAGSYAVISTNEHVTGIVYSGRSPVSTYWDTNGLSSPTAQYLHVKVIGPDHHTVITESVRRVYYVK